jgi:hypothetical protein
MVHDLGNEQPLAVTVLTIPELFDLIQVYITSNLDLIRLTQVSKAFSLIFGPLLWHTIEIKTEAQHNCFVNNPQVQDAIKRHGKDWIRVIRIRTPKSLTPFLQAHATSDDAGLSLLRLHTLEFPWPRHHAFENQQGVPRVPIELGLSEKEKEQIIDPCTESLYLEKEVFYRARNDPPVALEQLRPLPQQTLAPSITNPSRGPIDRNWSSQTQSNIWLQRRRAGA